MNDLERRAMAADAVRRQQQNKPVDPLPVMMRFAEVMEDYFPDRNRHWPQTVWNAWIKFLHTINQMRRERGQTAAGAHVRKLKEADNG